MNKQSLIKKKIEKEFGFKVVSYNYFPEYAMSDYCLDITLDFEGTEYFIEAGTKAELLEKIELELL